MDKIQFKSLPYKPFRLTSPFIPRDSLNKRTNLPVGATSYHDGIDLGRDRTKYPEAYSEQPAGAVFAVMDGTITESKHIRGRGHLVAINHGNIGNKEIRTVYQHLCKKGLDVGTEVKAGDVIGQMGRTGMGADMAIHLHFELQVSGKPVDPLPYIEELNKPKHNPGISEQLKRLSDQLQKKHNFSDKTIQYFQAYKHPEALIWGLLQQKQLSKPTIDYLKSYPYAQEVFMRVYSKRL